MTDANIPPSVVILKLESQIEELEIRNTLLQQVIDRLADEQQLNEFGDCDGDKGLWCANEVMARIKYAAKHASAISGHQRDL